ncbi:MAG: DUF1571 domain-containing protein [Thermoguttaceae bacterium]
MVICKFFRFMGMCLLPAGFFFCSLVWTQAAEPPVKNKKIVPSLSHIPVRKPAFQLAERAETLSQAAAPLLSPSAPNEHPLMPALRWAYSGIGNIEKISDYSATLAKRERIDGKLNDYEHMFIKVRHHPFSVYMYFLSQPKGQEVIYVEGANDNLMLAHTTGIKDKMFGTVKLKPDGPIAMKGQRYPLTELGILNLTRRLVQVAEQDIKYGECEVKFFKNAKINNRVCTCVQVVHPVPRRNFLFNIARIFVDDELNIPIRYESYGWPKEPGASPELIEEYTYLNVKLNNGFTDADFDAKNPNYHFR